MCLYERDQLYLKSKTFCLRVLPLREGSHSCPIELVVDGFEQLNLRQIEESAPRYLKGAL